MGNRDIYTDFDIAIPVAKVLDYDSSGSIDARTREHLDALRIWFDKSFDEAKAIARSMQIVDGMEHLMVEPVMSTISHKGARLYEREEPVITPTDEWLEKMLDIFDLTSTMTTMEATQHATDWLMDIEILMEAISQHINIGDHQGAIDAISDNLTKEVKTIANRIRCGVKVKRSDDPAIATPAPEDGMENAVVELSPIAWAMFASDEDFPVNEQMASAVIEDEWCYLGIQAKPVGINITDLMIHVNVNVDPDRSED